MVRSATLVAAVVTLLGVVAGCSRFHGRPLLRSSRSKPPARVEASPTRSSAVRPRPVPDPVVDVPMTGQD